MFKSVFITTLFAFSAVQSSADTNDIYDLTNLPADVAAHVIELQKHGDRYDAVIREIFLEAAKPSWTFRDCEHDAVDAGHSEPGS